MLKVSQDWVLKLLLAIPFNIGSLLYQPHPYVGKKLTGRFSSPHSQRFLDCAASGWELKLRRKKGQDPAKVS